LSGQSRRHEFGSKQNDARRPKECDAALRQRVESSVALYARPYLFTYKQRVWRVGASRLGFGLELGGTHDVL
jgi:hypothetical protein